jgi:hypothetical protein
VVLAPLSGDPTGRVYAGSFGVQDPTTARDYAGPMRRLATLLGVLAILAGGVWILQGIGVLPGSFMSGDPTWAWIGAGTGVVGIGVVIWGRRLATG